MGFHDPSLDISGENVYWCINVDQCLMRINADQKFKIMALIRKASQCLSMPDQGISKTLVKTVNTLRVVAALRSQNI